MSEPMRLYLHLGGADVSLQETPGADALQLDYALTLEEGERAPDRVERTGAASARAVFDGLGEVEDRVVGVHLGGRLAVVQRTWRLRGRGRARFPFAIEFPLPVAHWVVPAVMYDGNRMGRGSFPVGGPEVGWSFREDRVALPAASFVADAERSIGLWTEPARSEQDLGSVRTLARVATVRLQIETPGVEEPRAYRRKLGPASPPVHRWAPLEGARTRRFCVYRGPGGPHGWHEALRWTWERAQPPRAVDWAPIVRAKASHAANNLFFRRGRAAGFTEFLTDEWVPLLNTFSAGFLGRGAELALALWRVGALTGEERLQKAGADAADFLGGGRLANGLFYTDYQLARRRWCGLAFPPRQETSCRAMGEAATSLLRLHELASRRGQAHAAWLDQARALGDFFVANLPADGNPGRWWSRDGRRYDDTGTNGAYIVWLLAELSRATGEGRYLAPMHRAADHFAELARNGTLGGDTLDAECIDKEAGHAVLRALLAAWRADGRAGHLEGAVAAARFVDTWVWTWDVPFGPATPLGRRGFRTTGGTAVSVAHHHLDPYGAAIALDYLRLAKATGDEHWRRVARHLLAWCGQLVATPQDPLGMSPLFAGFQPEQVNHTDWSYWLQALTPRGSFFSNAAWVTALTLGALLDLREEFPEEVGAFRVEAPELRAPAAIPLRRLVRRALSYVNFVA